MRRKVLTVNCTDTEIVEMRSVGVCWLCLGCRLLVLYLHPHLALHAQGAAHRRPHVPAGAALERHVMVISKLATKIREAEDYTITEKGLLLVESAY